MFRSWLSIGLLLILKHFKKKYSGWVTKSIGGPDFTYVPKYLGTMVSTSVISTMNYRALIFTTKYNNEKIESVQKTVNPCHFSTTFTLIFLRVIRGRFDQTHIRNRSRKIQYSSSQHAQLDARNLQHLRYSCYCKLVVDVSACLSE